MNFVSKRRGSGEKAPWWFKLYNPNSRIQNHQCKRHGESLSTWHGASLGFGWRSRPPDMNGTCEYIEQVVAASREAVVFQLGGLTRD